MNIQTTRTDTNLPRASWPEYGPNPVRLGRIACWQRQWTRWNADASHLSALCSKAMATSADRTSPPMGPQPVREPRRKKQGCLSQKPSEYYANYQVDVGCAVHEKEMAKLHAEMREARESLDESPDGRRLLDAWPAVERINEAVRRSQEAAYSRCCKHRFYEWQLLKTAESNRLVGSDPLHL